MVYLSVTISYPSTQFEELYGPFVNLGVHLLPKYNSPFFINYIKTCLIFFEEHNQFEFNQCNYSKFSQMLNL